MRARMRLKRENPSNPSNLAVAHISKPSAVVVKGPHRAFRLGGGGQRDAVIDNPAAAPLADALDLLHSGPP